MVNRGGGNRINWGNHQSKMGDYYPATSLDLANETWTVLKLLDRVYGQGYGRIGSDWVSDQDVISQHSTTWL